MLLCGLTVAALAAGAQHETALRLASRHDYNGAIQALRQEIARDSTAISAYVAIADYYRYADKIEDGKAIFAASGHANAHLTLALLYRYEGDWKHVFSQSLLAVQKNPSDAAMELLTDAADRLRKGSTVSAMLRKLKKQPGKQRAYALLSALWQIRQGAGQRAITRLRGQIEKRPDDSFARLLLAEVLQAGNKQREALPLLRQALKSIPLSSMKVRVRSLVDLTGACFATSKPDSARLFARRALALARSSGDLSAEVAIASRFRDDFKKNDLFHELDEMAAQAIDASRLLGSIEGVADFLADRGACMSLAGDPKQARAYYLQAFRSAPGPEMRAQVSVAIGEIGLKYSNFDSAAVYFQRAVSEAEKARAADLQHRALLGLAETEIHAGRRHDAKGTIQKVLRYSQKTQQHFLTEKCFMMLANLFIQRPDEFAKASYYLSMADALSRQTFELRFAANHRWMQGNIALAKNNIEQAEVYFLDAVQLGKETGSHLAFVAGQAGLVRTYNAAEFHEMASAHADTALTYLLAYYDLFRKELWGKYFDFKRDLISPAIAAYSSVGYLEKIYMACDLYKAIRHTEEITGLATFLADPELEAANRELKSSAQAIEDAWKILWMGQEDDPEVDMRTRKRIQKLSAGRQEVLRRLRRDRPEFYRLIRPYSKSLSELQAILRRSNSAMIHYFVEPAATFAVVVLPNDIHCKRINVPSALLENLVHNTSQLFTNVGGHFVSNDQSAPAQFRMDHAGRLFELLVQPLEPWLMPDQHVIIAADGVLNRLPFEMLVTNPASLIDPYDYGNSKFLIEERPISYVESSAFVQDASTSKVHRKTLLFMSPPLAGGAPEAEQNRILRVFANREVTVAGDSAATRGLYLEQGPGHRILHLALPANLDDRRPLGSFVRFADGQKVTAHELFGMKFDSDLAVLAGSERDLCSIDKSNGEAGILHGFNYAGVPSVAVSLWQVSSLGSATLYADFYANLKKGKNKAQALQLAKIDYLKRGRRNPYHWANIVLMGSSASMQFEKKQDYVLAYLAILAGLLVVLLLVRQLVGFLSGKKSRIKRRQARPGNA